MIAEPGRRLVGVGARRILRVVLVVTMGAHPSGLAEVVCTENDDSIVITRAGHHVLTYHKTAKVPEGVDPKYARSGFLHPISTPSGRVVTDDYPVPHHSHQHGLFFAWKKASVAGRSLNFWEADKGGEVRHAKVVAIMNEEGFAGFQVELVHASGSRAVLRESWTVKVSEGSGWIDLRSEQRCAGEEPVTLERHHYGGLAVRGSRQWFKDAHTSAGKGARKDEFVEACRMITSEGLTQADGNHSRPAWVAMTGPVDGAPVSITLIPHPTNVRHPQHVRLHPEMPYFCFLPSVEKAFTIEPGKPLVTRVRMVVADGDPVVAELDAVQEAYRKAQ